MVIPQALERTSTSTPNSRHIDERENQPFGHGDRERAWEVNHVAKPTLINTNNSCSSHGSLINCNEGLDDGDDLVS